MEASKKWYLSKTLWANVVALAAMVIQGATGWIVAPEYQGYALIAVNMALRAITKSPLEWSK